MDTRDAEVLAPDGVDLADLLAPDPGLDGELEPGPEAPWRIEDDDDAEWALSVLAAAEVERDRVIAHAEAVKRRAEEWADRILNERRHDGHRSLPSVLETIRTMSAHLEWYGRRQRAAGRATVDLVGGTVRTRKVNPTVVVTDEAALVEWAKGNAPELVRVREDVQVSTLRKWVSPSGEAGVVLHPPAGDGEDPRPPVVLDAIPGVGVEPEGVGVTVTPRAATLELPVPEAERVGEVEA